MSGCNGCFNGCAEILSDQCVRYTGDPIASLDIATNDPLSTVIEKITDYLTTVMDGTGIEPTIAPEYICDLINGFLPASPTLVDILTALVRAACSLQADLDAVEADIATIEANYVPGCISVAAGAGTHAVLQAVIAKVCAIATDVIALQAALSTYVPIADIDVYIAAYLASIGSAKHYTKMVPYTVVMFYDSISGKFDSNGVGYGDWEQIYLCNGYNGLTPDMRGRVPVGCTVCSVPYGDINTDPAFPGNPNYSLGMEQGTNKVTLGLNNLPSHNHTAISIPNDPGHRHIFGGDRTAITPMGFEKYNDVATGYDVNADGPPNIDYGAIPFYTKSSSNQVAQAFQTTGITVSTTVNDTGGNVAHDNIQPVKALHFIMYIPA